MDSKLKLYVGCSLTHAPQEFMDNIANFKEALSSKFEILEFLGLKGTPREAYEKDIQECVAECDLMLSFCDFPSLGLGYELGTAIEKYSKPVLAVAHKDSFVSNLIIGIDHPMYNFDRYSDIIEVENMIQQKAQKHFPKIQVEVCETDICAV